jgi:hypothetical protein
VQTKGTQPASPDPDLLALQQAWSPSWRIWRARRSMDPPGVFEGDFMATRMHDDAGPDRTVMCSTAAELDAALREQRELAEQGTAPLSVGYPV